ncbi:MAG: phage replication initiation protein, NGO0469 family [Candidatus Hodarchaeales archaeon]
MAIVGKESNGKDFEQLPAGTYNAICIAVHDLGMQENTYKGETKVSRKIILQFEVGKKDSEGRAFMINEFYTLSLGDRANLRKLLNSWISAEIKGVDLQEDGYDVEKLVGKAGMLTAIEKTNQSTGKVRTVVGSMSPLMDGMESIKQTIKIDKTPDWIQKIADQAVKFDDAKAPLKTAKKKAAKKDVPESETPKVSEDEKTDPVVEDEVPW